MIAPEQSPPDLHPMPEPVMPLDYGRPTPRVPGRAREFVLCIIISLALAVGGGCVTFGVMLAQGVRDDPAAFTAWGVAMLFLALSLTGTIAWMRFTRR